MSRFFLGLALWALLLALAACGGDSKGTDPARDAELAEMVDTVVSTFDDLTVCTDKREGSTAYVEDEKKAYVCESKRWTVNDSLTESIQNKDSDSAQDAESGEDVDTVVPTFDDLPACTGDLNGKTAYVEDEDSAYVCKKGFWVVDDSLTKAIQPDSEKKSSSSAKAKSSSNKASDSSSSDKSRSSSSAVKTSSSSKDGKSSSSDEKNSSSSSVALPCKTETEDNCEYGTLTDDRDGQTYKTVKIGGQWWMAENLNYAYTDVPFKYSSYTSDSTSWCYDNDAANCAKYGRLYTWAAAMDSVGTWSTNGMGCGCYMVCSPTNPVRGICPEGWHLPDITEWNALFDAVGGRATAGIMLKSTEGWISNGNGSDAYFFSASPAGYRDYGGYFVCEGYTAFFWSSTEDISSDAYYMRLYYGDDDAYLLNDIKYLGFSVRCLMDYKSSSSEKNSSSSSVVPLGCKTETEDNCEYGTLTDDRDGQTYKTVKIGEQWWMAENLNYAYTGVPFKDGDFTSDSTSWCYDNDTANCAKYGRLYTWAAAMDSAGIIPGNSANGCGYGKDCNLGDGKVRGVCPMGWHLPDTTEWNALFDAVGGKETAGIMLKSTEGWINNGNGSDTYFFSALPAGDRYSSGGFYGEGNLAFFWSSTEGGSDYAYSMYLYYSNFNAYLINRNKDYGFSVHCLRD
ncbi:fibrobacter succinogenes major paralogous domain-containing protein [uncultured Fibrobacter sp.]|uniref:fibrobacter succinogenes major paralogous domain-containing protein n=1 Tax=uncultured Fibrobacter sp. TaxID=261512 RepID=UPI0025F74477|nr:fibrobacter succinogenes major paralogous domain-containing protein [uncultured Fibrobacter sp.]